MRAVLCRGRRGHVGLNSCAFHYSSCFALLDSIYSQLVASLGQGGWCVEKVCWDVGFAN